MEWKTEWWSNGWKQYWLKVYFPFGTLRVLMLQLYRTRDLSSALDYRKLESVDGNRFSSALFISVDVLWGSDSLGKCCFPSGTCIRISFFSREISWNIVFVYVNKLPQVSVTSSVWLAQESTFPNCFSIPDEYFSAAFYLKRKFDELNIIMKSSSENLNSHVCSNPLKWKVATYSK